MVRRATASLDSPAAKVIAVLNAVAGRGTASVSSIATELAIPPPTIHRIANELERLGYLQREPGSRQLTVSEPLINLASSVLVAASSRAAVQVILRKCSETIGEMCSLGVQVGDEVVYVASAEPQQDLMLSFRAGRKAPLFCTSSGRLFLARLSDEELQRYLEGSRRKAYTRYTQTRADRIFADVRRAREQGFAMANQEYMLHIVGAAVPVTAAEGKLIAALSVAALNVRVSLQRLREFIPELQRAAGELALSFTQTASRPPDADAFRPKRKLSPPPARRARR
jgi:IclR family transcriptional regulator, acetate operon repressor